MSEEKQQYSFEEVLSKLKSYCAYQERSKREVSEKAFSFGIDEDMVEKLIDSLEKDKYLDEVRFSKVYARSKFNSNHWGRFKIIEGLKIKGINASNTNLALNEISKLEIQKKIKFLIGKRNVKQDSRDKQIRFLLSKGYALNEIIDAGV